MSDMTLAQVFEACTSLGVNYTVVALHEWQHAAILAALREHDTLAAEIRRRDGEACETCKHQTARPYRPDDPYCAVTAVSDGVHITVTMVPCRFLGNGCRAWQKRERE
jgi:lambda repressor-like predicted transcriptional regulator